MSKAAFDKIAERLTEALEIARGNELREACRNLLRLKQEHPDTFAQVCRLLTAEDMQTLAELAEEARGVQSP